MGTKVIDERAWTEAPAATVYALLRDGATWPEWSAIDSFELQSEGRGGGEGLDAVRVFHTGRHTSVERIVELVPDRRFSYALLSGLPLKGYRADVDLEPRDGGTAIRWRSTFRPKVPGTGWIYRAALAKFIAGCVKGLAERATTDASAHAPEIA